MVHEVLSAFVDFVTNPIVQLAAWGVVTILVFGYTFDIALDEKRETPSAIWHVGAAFLMIGYWICNASMWFFGHLDWMIYSDGMFLITCLLMVWRSRLGWSVILAFLAGVTFVLDMWLWKELSSPLFAWLSNITYALQLWVVSGWFPFLKQYRKV